MNEDNIEYLRPDVRIRKLIDGRFVGEINCNPWYRPWGRWMAVNSDGYTYSNLSICFSGCIVKDREAALHNLAEYGI